MAHTYASLQEAMDFAKDDGYDLTAGMWAVTSSNRALALSFLESASRRVDEWCMRSAFDSGFGPRLGTNRYDGDGCAVLDLRDDLISVTSITVRPSTASATTSTPAANTDYYLQNQRGQYEPGPFRRIVLHGQGTVTAFGAGLRVTDVAGVFGYQSVTRALTPTTSEAIDLTETDIDVSGLAGLSPGQTLLLDSEQVYVRSVTDSTTDSISVDRAVNGTTAATHLTGLAIARYVYPAAVVEGTARLWLRRWRARDAGADGVDGGGDVGIVQARESEDTILRRTVGHLRMGVRVRT